MKALAVALAGSDGADGKPSNASDLIQASLAGFRQLDDDARKAAEKAAAGSHAEPAAKTTKEPASVDHARALLENLFPANANKAGTDVAEAAGKQTAPVTTKAAMAA